MRILALFIFLLQWTIPPLAHAASYEPKVQVAEAYIEMHTGPGEGYPVFHVVERGKWITILVQRTDWFRIRTDKGKEGWVRQSQIAQTLDPTGNKVVSRTLERKDYENRRWEIGLLTGRFEGANVISLYGGYSFTPNLAVEISGEQVLGNYSESLLANVNLVAQPFPKWKVSPFFTLGAGYIETRPRVVLVQSIDRSDLTAHVGIGARMYLSRRFFLRAEYKNYKVFTSRDDNEEIDEWKIGFGIFF